MTLDSQKKGTIAVLVHTNSQKRQSYTNAYNDFEFILGTHISATETRARCSSSKSFMGKDDNSEKFFLSLRLK